MRYLFFIVVFFLGGFVYANPLSLLHAYKLALINQEDFDIAQQELDIQGEIATQARSALLPQISASRRFTQAEKGLPFLQDTRQDVISLSQSVFNYTNISTNRRAQHALTTANLRYQQRIQTLTYDTVQAYFNILNSKVALKYAKRYTQSIKQHLDNTKKRYDLRNLTKVDLVESQSSYASSKLDELRLDNQLFTRKSVLANYIGMSNETYNIDLMHYNNLNQLEINHQFDYWLNLAKQNSYDIAIQKSIIQTSSADIEIAKSNHLPTIDFFADYTHNNLPSGFVPKEEINYGLQLSVPIFQGFSSNSRVAQARTAKSQAKLTLNKTYKTLKQNIKTTYNNLIFYKDRIKSLKTLVDYNNAKLTLTQRSFDSGARTNLELILASSELQDSKRDLNLSMHNYVLSYLGLENTAGTLTTNDIKNVNDVLFSY